MKQGPLERRVDGIDDLIREAKRKEIGKDYWCDAPADYQKAKELIDEEMRTILLDYGLDQARVEEMLALDSGTLSKRLVLLFHHPWLEGKDEKMAQLIRLATLRFYLINNPQSSGRIAIADSFRNRVFGFMNWMREREWNKTGSNDERYESFKVAALESRHLLAINSLPGALTDAALQTINAIIQSESIDPVKNRLEYLKISKVVFGYLTHMMEIADPGNEGGMIDITRRIIFPEPDASFAQNEAIRKTDNPFTAEMRIVNRANRIVRSDYALELMRRNEEQFERLKKVLTDFLGVQIDYDKKVTRDEVLEIIGEPDAVIQEDFDSE